MSGLRRSRSKQRFRAAFGKRWCTRE